MFEILPSCKGCYQNLKALRTQALPLHSDSYVILFSLQKSAECLKVVKIHSSCECHNVKIELIVNNTKRSHPFILALEDLFVVETCLAKVNL